MLNTLFHFFKFGIKVHKNSGWSTNFPLIKLLKFQLWDFGGMCYYSKERKYTTKSILVGWGKDRYIFTMVNLFKTFKM